MKTKKIIAFLLSALLITSLFSTLTAGAQASVPIEITTEQQLKDAIANSAKDNMTGEATQIKLMNDIRMNDDVHINFGRNIHVDLNNNRLAVPIIQIDAGKLSVDNGVISSFAKRHTIVISETAAPESLFKAKNTRLYASVLPVDDIHTLHILKGRVELDNCYIQSVQVPNSDNNYETFSALHARNAVVVLKDSTFSTNGASLYEMYVNKKLVDTKDCVDDNGKAVPGSEIRKEVYIVDKGYVYDVTDGTIDNGDFNIANAGAPASVYSRIPEPVYTVTIPTTVSVKATRAYSKYENSESDRVGNPIVVKESFVISAVNVKNLFNGSLLKVTIGNATDSFTLSDGTHSFPITLGTKKGEIETPYTLGTEFALFNNDLFLTEGETNSQNGYIEVNRAKIPASGTYTGTLTFNISVKEAN